MIEDRIRELREKLNKSMSDDNNFEKIYEMSLELDNLILKYYRDNGNGDWKLY
ncbi:MAG: aspartyl-phosphate phosphatase Spo0E family protein [Clostridia bacterium]|nr:aspartyl-phosphate phosphatase Spo0E family protein [Clostridia bacterium]